MHACVVNVLYPDTMFLTSYREDNADGKLKVVLLTPFFCMLLLCIRVLILEVSWIKKKD